MPEYLAPGVFVEERPGGVKPIAGVSTSTIGMVGVTERGPVNRPTLVTNFGNYTRVFGGLLNARVFTDHRDVLPLAVQGGFDNGAGRIYVNRIVGDDATFGSADLFGNDTAAPAATALSVRAAAGAVELLIDDDTNIVDEASLLLSDGPRSEIVTVTGDPTAVGIAITGQLRADQPDTAAVAVQDPAVEGTDLTAGVTGDMDAGGPLDLDAATVLLLAADNVLRIRQIDGPALTEFVTISAPRLADFNEGVLLFDHPQATVEVHIVTLADSATTTTVDGDTAAGSPFVALAATAGIDADEVVAIGAGAAREFHVVRAIVSTIDTTPTTAIHPLGTAVLSQVGLLQVHARDEGVWSDRLRVRIAASPLTETTIVADAAVGESPITLGSSVGLHPGSVISITRDPDANAVTRVRVAAVDHGENQIDIDGGVSVALEVDDVVTSQEFTLIVELLDEDGRVSDDEAFANLAVGPAHPRYAPTIVGSFDRAADESSLTGLSALVRLSDLTRDDNGVDLAGAAAARLSLPFDGVSPTLDGGDDDLATLDETAYIGQAAEDVEDRTGIHALTGIDDISIVAVPGRSEQTVQNAMITHCETMRYRIAVLDSAPHAQLADIRAQRQLYDSTRGALYYPWLVVADPFGLPDDRLGIPPSGHVCGAFARTDNERGVHKAPANVVVRNILGLEANVVTGQQEILNPRGINVIRNFASLGRAIRIWGARTISSDPEWIYVPVRRLFLFVEKSIERGMQFAVFEPNDQRLWSTVERSVNNFLTSVWRDGALAGATPEESFFVDVGLTTMTQGDIDAGRLIVNIGIAPVKPAEFVIFRISQKTAGAA